MNNSMNDFSGPEKNIPQIVVTENSSKEAIEYVPKFKHIQEDLQYMFEIKVENEDDLYSTKIKDKLYKNVREDIQQGKPFALDYMFEEGLLTKEDLEKRGIKDLKQQALSILKTFKDPRLTSIRNLFINTGILTEEEVGAAISL